MWRHRSQQRPSLNTTTLLLISSYCSQTMRAELFRSSFYQVCSNVSETEPDFLLLHSRLESYNCTRRASIRLRQFLSRHHPQVYDVIVRLCRRCLSFLSWFQTARRRIVFLRFCLSLSNTQQQVQNMVSRCQKISKKFPRPCSIT